MKQNANTKNVVAPTGIYLCLDILLFKYGYSKCLWYLTNINLSNYFCLPQIGPFYLFDDDAKVSRIFTKAETRNLSEDEATSVETSFC